MEFDRRRIAEAYFVSSIMNIATNDEPFISNGSSFVFVKTFEIRLGIQ